MNRPVDRVNAPGALDVDAVGAVDHDFGDVQVAQVRLERPISEDVVGDLLGDAGAVGEGERGVLRREHFLQRQADLLLDLALGQPRVVELGPEVLQQCLVHGPLELGERVAARVGRAAPAPSTRLPSRSRCLSEPVGEVTRISGAAYAGAHRRSARGHEVRGSFRRIRRRFLSALDRGLTLADGATWRSANVRMDGLTGVLGVLEHDGHAAVDRGRDVSTGRDLPGDRYA